MNLDALYRAHAPEIASSLAKSFGASRLDLIEQAVQEAFVAAIEAWRELPPEKPAAWLHAVARRKLVDALRRAAWVLPGEQLDALEAAPTDAFDEGDLLAMLFACCHPALPIESALALALRTLCGFPIAALCRALYADGSAIEKRLARARQVLRDEQVELALGETELATRLPGVSRTLYVLFAEGYSVHAGARQIDQELCASAIRLASLLAMRIPAPQTHALLSLMLLQASRFAARLDERGDLVPLDRQDRAKWDRALIERGLYHLAEASAGDEISPYHVEAAIAATHALAPTYDATDWRGIVDLYDRLLALQPSPVVALQRAIAIGRADGARAGLRALEQVAGDARLDDDPVLAAAIGELEHQRGDARAARAAYRRALELAATEPERRFLEAKLAALAAN